MAINENHISNDLNAIDHKMEERDAKNSENNFDQINLFENKIYSFDWR